MKHLPALIAISLSAALLATGCTGYRFCGATLPTEERSIALAELVNLTGEARLTPLVKNSLAQALEKTPGISTVSTENAGLLLHLRLTRLSQSSAARALIRDAADRQDDGDAYQSVLFRLTLCIEYTATSTAPGRPERHGTVNAAAEVPMMPDHEQSFAAALRQLARDAAGKLTAAITEAGERH